MPSIYRRKNRKGEVLPHWYIQYSDMHGKTLRKRAYRSKSLSLQLANKLEQEERCLRDGIALPKTLPVEYKIACDKYISDMKRRGLSYKHIKESLRILRQFSSSDSLLAEAFTTQTVTHFLNELSKKDRSARTTNAYRTMLFTFGIWCVDQNMLRTNPVKTIKTAKKCKKHIKRAFTSQEIVKLIHAARCDLRALAYNTAARTGLRREELVRLRWEYLSGLGTAKPELRLPAAATKEKRAAILPLNSYLADTLDKYKKPNGAVFHPDDIPTADQFDADLKRAGIEKIDSNGKRLSFHSLRYYFCTQLAKSCPITVVQRFMRHADINMTASLYLDLNLNDYAEQANAFPANF